MSIPIKVAVIDDDKSARTSLARLIKTAGIEVVSFSSAHEFLDDPCRTQVDCAVTDVRMPGVDGFELQETLAQTVPYLSVVFITGHGDIPWDQASVLVQVGLLDPAGLPVAGVETALKVADRTRPSNELMARWAESKHKAL